MLHPAPIPRQLAQDQEPSMITPVLSLFGMAFLLGLIFNAPGAVFAETIRRGVDGGYRPALAVRSARLQVTRHGPFSALPVLACRYRRRCCGFLWELVARPILHGLPLTAGGKADTAIHHKYCRRHQHRLTVGGHSGIVEPAKCRLLGGAWQRVRRTWREQP